MKLKKKQRDTVRFCVAMIVFAWVKSELFDRQLKTFAPPAPGMERA